MGCFRQLASLKKIQTRNKKKNTNVEDNRADDGERIKEEQNNKIRAHGTFGEHERVIHNRQQKWQNAQHESEKINQRKGAPDVTCGNRQAQKEGQRAQRKYKNHRQRGAVQKERNDGLVVTRCDNAFRLRDQIPNSEQIEQKGKCDGYECDLSEAFDRVHGRIGQDRFRCARRLPQH